MRKPAFAYAKTKTQISFAVTVKLINAFVFATWIVQSLYFLYSLVCVLPGRKPRRPVFSQRGSNVKQFYLMVRLIFISKLARFKKLTQISMFSMFDHTNIAKSFRGTILRIKILFFNLHDVMKTVGGTKIS